MWSKVISRCYWEQQQIKLKLTEWFNFQLSIFPRSYNSQPGCHRDSQHFPGVVNSAHGQLYGLQGRTHQDALGDVLLTNKSRGKWSENWPVGIKTTTKKDWTMGHFAAVEHSDIWRDRVRWRVGMRRKQETEPELELVGFLRSQGLFVEAAFKAYRLGPGHQHCQWELHTGKVCNLP